MRASKWLTCDVCGKEAYGASGQDIVEACDPCWAANPPQAFYTPGIANSLFDTADSSYNAFAGDLTIEQLEKAIAVFDTIPGGFFQPYEYIAELGREAQRKIEREIIGGKD